MNIECNGGYDTFGIKYKNELSDAMIVDNCIVLDKYSRITKEGEIILVLKPSNEITNGKTLSNLTDSLEAISRVEEQFSLNRIGLSRIDFSIDFINIYEGKIYRLLLECINAKRLGNGVFETRRPISLGESMGNYKISSHRVETTIYNCSDKNRLGKIRLENRISNIRTKDPSVRNRMILEVNKFIKELHFLETHIPDVESIYINFLTKEYVKTIGKKFRTFTEFVAWADKNNYILTETILKELLKKSGLKTRFNKFTYQFRKKRIESLEFITKTQLKTLIMTIKKEFRKIN